MSNYEVKYDIQVKTHNSVGVLQAFEKAVAPLTQTAKTMDAIVRVMNRFNNATSKLKPATIKLTVDIPRGTEQRLDAILNKIRLIRKESRAIAPGVARTTGLSAGAPVAAARKQRASLTARNSSLAYKTLGPTPIDVNGVAAIDFLKGMGIAYGIAGAGQLVSSIIKNATEYDNLMQSTKNILQTHDKQGNFDKRFREMEAVVRKVGVETKFTAPEVADAAKFLAMAGLDIDAIKVSMPSIADIALVGDTQLGETADVVTNIMTAYRRGPEKMRNTADVMTMTFTKSNTTLMEMAEAYKYSAALLEAGGVSFEEASGALGVLGDAGIKGSQAGTTMRTIMANLVNPTKKQLKHWKAIGVERFDDDGNLRQLRDIFKDLSEKDLSVADFYKIFHKTAAQGAVSLANSVEKWNDIVTENFLSDGLAADLADKKKNTIQGLWAQLTSTFTEDGMVAFSGIQESIKDALRAGIEWLKKPEVAEGFRKGAYMFLEFGGMMVDSLKQIGTMIEKVGWAFKYYFKFQLWIYPLLSVIRGVKSLILLIKSTSLLRGGVPALLGLNLGTGLPSGGAGGPGGYTGTSFYKRNYQSDPTGWFPNAKKWYYKHIGDSKRLNSISSFLSGGMPVYSSSYANKIEAFTKDAYNKKGIRGRDARDYWQTKYKEHFKKFDSQLSDKKLQRTSLSALVDQYYQGATSKEKKRAARQDLRQIFDNNQKDWKDQNDKAIVQQRKDAEKAGKRARLKYKTASFGSAALTGASGIAAGAMMGYATDWSPGGTLMAGLTTAGSLAMLGPAGVVAGAVVGVGSLAVAWMKVVEESNKARQATLDYCNTIQIHNGLWLGEEATQAQLRLAMTKSENMEINELMKTRIRLLKELYGIGEGPVDTTGISISKVKVDDFYNRHFDNVNHWWNKEDMGQSAVALSRKLAPSNRVGEIIRDKNGRYYYKDTNTWHELNDPSNSWTDWSNEKSVAAMLVMGMQQAATGEEQKQIATRFEGLKRKALWGNLGLDAIKNIAKEYEENHGYDVYFKGYKDAQGEWHKRRVDEKTYPWSFQYGIDTVRADPDILGNSYAYLRQLHETFAPRFGKDAPYLQIAEKYYKAIESGSIDEPTVLDFIREFDGNLSGHLAKYAENGLKGLYETFGFNPETQKFEKGLTGFQAHENAKHFVDFAAEFNKLFPQMPEPAQKALLELANNINWLRNFGLTQMEGENGFPTFNNVKVKQYKPGDELTIGDTTYVRQGDDTTMKWLDKNSPLRGFQDDQTIQQAKAASDGTTDDDKKPRNNYGATGTDPGYRNNYKSTAGAPKQVIVKIENLMNVDKIDLSKPENKAVIENIKEQMAQALIDVVHDFTISTGNMV